MSLETLLAILADGQFHSGDELGSSLGVSRTAIWKQLKKVEHLGLELVSVKGKGYCIEGGLDLLSEQGIKEGLDERALSLVSQVDVRQVVDSTNVLAMEKALAGGKGYVCTAEQQTAGRGRRGRQWASPFGSNLYFSIVWEFAGGAAALEGLSLAVGVAVVDALQEAGVNGVQLKWPNDVLYGGSKLAGVLLEMTGDAAGPCQVVVGVGLNVAMPAAAAGTIDQSWTDLSSIADSPVRRNQLMALLLNQLLPLLDSFEPQGFVNYQQRWLSLDAYAGKDVVVTLGADVVLGVAAGVEPSGALIVDTGVGRRTFSGGEVTLRTVL